MNEPEEKRAVVRIMVAIDSCATCLTAFERAAALAEHQQAELVGLFIEDLDLVNFAALPFASEIDRGSGSVRRLDSLRMTRALRAQAEQARRELQRIARQRQLHTRLEVVRGRYAAEALSAATGMDIAFLIRGNTPRARARRRSAAPPVWVFYDGSAGATRALALARELAAPGEADMVVVLPQATPDTLRPLRERAISTLAEYSRHARFERLASADLSALSDAIAHDGGSLLLIDRGNAHLAERGGQRFIESVDCPVVLVS